MHSIACDVSVLECIGPSATHGCLFFLSSQTGNAGERREINMVLSERALGIYTAWVVPR